jgi:hypothetical protein
MQPVQGLNARVFCRDGSDEKRSTGFISLALAQPMSSDRKAVSRNHGTALQAVLGDQSLMADLCP